VKPVKLVISRAAWNILLNHYAETMGEDAAQKFMDMHFIKTEPLPLRPFPLRRQGLTFL
jgi:hypothetical protein